MGERVEEEPIEEERPNGLDDEDIILDGRKTTEVDVNEALENAFSSREQLYADVTLTIAEDLKIFDHHLLNKPATDATYQTANIPKEKDLTLCGKWTSQLKSIQLIDQHHNSSSDPLENTIQPGMHANTVHDEHASQIKQTVVNQNEELHSIVSWLNEEQLIAYTIIRNHVL